MRQVLSGDKKNNLIPLNLISYVFFAWLVGIIILLLAQVLIGTNGLTIYPAGEDFTWMRLVQQNKNFSLHHQWWEIASRNPLGPWWYFAISPIILKFPEGLYLARKTLDFFLAVSTLLVIYELVGERRAWLALWSAILVLFWNFSSYMEQVLLIMLISLGFSMLSVYFYLIYLKSDRVRHGFLVTSLITFFIALATYSIQCGVPLAILAIGLIYASKYPSFNEKMREIKKTILDLLGYIAIFILFTQIWITTSGTTSRFFKLDIALFTKNFLASLKLFAWHSINYTLMTSIKTHWSTLVIVLVTSASVIIFSMLAKYRKMQVNNIFICERIEFLNFLLPLIIIMAISVPTILLESTSDLWAPGTRSEMLQQVFNPVFYIFVAILVIQFIRLFIKEKQAKIFASVFLISLCSFATVISLEYNRKLYEQSNFGIKLAKGLKSIVPEVTSPIVILAKIKNFNWYSGNASGLTNLYIQYVYNSPNIALDTVGDSSSVTLSDPVVFGTKEKGIYLPGIKRFVPYNTLLVVQVDEHGVVPIKEINPEKFPAETVKFAGIKEVHLNLKNLDAWPVVF